MDQLDTYLAEQKSRRVRELENVNARLREHGGGRTDHASPSSAPPKMGTRGSPADLGVLRQRLAEAEERIRELEEDLDKVLNSRSWRVLKALGIAKR